MTKKAAGLWTSPNRYDVPEGALVRASNVLILRDGVIQPRPGYVATSPITRVSSGGITVSHWHRSLFYRDTQYVAGYGSDGYYAIANCVDEDLAPVYCDTGVTPPCGISGYTTYTTNPCFDVEFLEVGKNLYYTTFYGIRRFDDPTSTSASRPSGNVPCVLSCFPRPTVVSADRTGTTVTVTWPWAHGFSNGITVQVTSSSADIPTGAYTITSVPSTTTFTFETVASGSFSGQTPTMSPAQFYGSSGFMATSDYVAYRACLVETDANGIEHTGMMSPRIEVFNGAPYAGNGSGKNVQGAILFPSSAYSLSGSTGTKTKFQIFRTKNGSSVPGGSYALVYERYLTATEIAQGFAWWRDITPSNIKGRAAYTDDGQEGDSGNSLPPPAAKTITAWKDRMVVGNVYGPSTIECQLISTDSASGGLASGEYISIDGNGLGLQPYYARSTAVTTIRDFLLYTGGTATVNVAFTVLSLIDTINWQFGNSSVSPLTTLYAGYLTISGDFPGRFFVSINNSRPEMFESDDSVTLTRVITSTNRQCFNPQPGALNFTSAATSRASDVTTLTMSSGGDTFKVGETVTLYLTLADRWSNIPATIGGTAVTGTVLTASATTVTISNAGSDGSVGASGNYIYSTAPTFNPNIYKNRVCVSKVFEPEAFPAFNYSTIGTDNNQILKMSISGESLLIFCTEGLFRMRFSGEDFTVELVDPTVKLWARDSVAKYKNKVFGFCIDGVYACTDTEVTLISAPIKDKLVPGDAAYGTVYYDPASSRAFGIVNEQEGVYDLRIPFGFESNFTAASPPRSTTNLIYNILNNTWTQDDLTTVSIAIYNGWRYIFKYYTDPANNSPKWIQDSRQRPPDKKPITTISSSFFSAGSGAVDAADFSVAGVSGASTAFFQDGDIYLIDGNLYKISDVVIDTPITFNTTAVTPGAPVLDGSAGEMVYYATPIDCQVEWAPITLVAENRLKLFSDIEILFGATDMYECDVSFYTELITTLETVDVGNFANGFGTNPNQYTYLPANLRLIVPQQHRRGQQLSVRLTIPTIATWTVLGIGAAADKQSTRVSRT